MKKGIALILLSLMLIAALTGCGENNNVSNAPASTADGNIDMQAAEPVQNEEKPPLVIYHISDDEIELHYTHENLENTEELVFLIPDGEDAWNPAVQLRLDSYDGEIHPDMVVLTEELEIAYELYENGGGMEASVDGDTLICNMRHEDIISAFDKVTLWQHGYTSEPLSFEGIITDDLTTAVWKPAAEGILPDEFKRSEYDDEFFKPDSDDFIVVSYELPIELSTFEWQREGGPWFYSANNHLDLLKSTAMVTYLISFDGGEYLGMKIRVEYASADEAMNIGYTIIPAELGLPDKRDDSLINDEYFEESDQLLFGEQSATDYEVVYQGHFDRFRYYDFKALDSIQELERLVSVRLTDNSEALTTVPLSSLNYAAGKTEKSSLLSYLGDIEATAFSSKQTHKAGSDVVVLEMISELPGDAEHFTPLTNDYAYVIECHISLAEAYGSDEEEGLYEQFTHLYSFDDTGNVVQHIFRQQHVEYLDSVFEHDEFCESFQEWAFDKESGAYYIDYLVEYGADYSSEDETDKQSIERDLREYGQHEGYYFSKP